MCTQKVLLLNASNMGAYPVFPYAFIQIPAVARRSNVEVVCKDLLGIPSDAWADILQGLIERHDPAMLLITLRNSDSLNAEDYQRDSSAAGSARAYFPIEQTRDLIAIIRECSDLKIALGGFGFSVMPQDLMDELRPDFGVFGDPDGFFEHFERIQAGDLAQVPNLLYFQDGQLKVNQRRFYPPLERAEYTPQAIEQMMAFYETFPSPGFQGAPIEMMRGCQYACVFCSEPHVKGKQVRYRDLDAVMDDIQILVEHGITQLYMISSELNPEDNDFVLELADRIHAFNQQRPEDRQVTWFGANYLLKFNQDDYQKLALSRFTGGWFDITALDDQNARAMRTPYRNEGLLPNLKTYADFERSQAAQATDAERTENDITVGWSMFLGNPATTLETIRSTLQIANQHGIAQLFDHCGVIAPVRVFEYEEPDDATIDVTYSVTRDLLRTGYRQTLPSFAYPPALLRDFGSEEEIAEAFKYIGETFLSTKYQRTRRWRRFLQQKTDQVAIASWISELSSALGVQVPVHLERTNSGRLSPAIQELFLNEEPSKQDAQRADALAKDIVDWLLAACLESFPDLWDSLGLPSSLDALDQTTPYDLAAVIFNRWSVVDEMYDELMEKTEWVWNGTMQDLSRFCIQAVLYRLNILFTPRYRSLFTLDSPS